MLPVSEFTADEYWTHEQFSCQIARFGFSSLGRPGNRASKQLLWPVTWGKLGYALPFQLALQKSEIATQQIVSEMLSVRQKDLRGRRQIL